MPCEKRAKVQIAHLVSSDTQANTKKKQKSYFLPTLKE